MNNPKVKGGLDQLIKDRFLLNDWKSQVEEVEETYTQDDIDADIAQHERELDE